MAIDVESREEVNEMVQNAVESGGSICMDTQDHGWMYAHSFSDLDGHQWEVMYIDETKMPQ